MAKHKKVPKNYNSMSRRISWIDLRAHLRRLKENLSFGWVALRSADLNKKCSKCLSIKSQYGEVSPTCVSCLGTGHSYVDKLISGHKTLALPGIDFKAEIGGINTTVQYYYLEHSTKPKTTDFILELDTDVTTGVPRQPFRIVRAYKITDSQPLRGDRGRIEYWKCLVKEQNFARGKPIVSKDRERPQVATTVPAVTVSDFYLGIDDNFLELSADYSFPITNIDGEHKKLYLQPTQAPPAGELKLTTIDGEKVNIELSEQ